MFLDFLFGNTVTREINLYGRQARKRRLLRATQPVQAKAKSPPTKRRRKRRTKKA